MSKLPFWLSLSILGHGLLLAGDWRANGSPAIGHSLAMQIEIEASQASAQHQRQVPIEHAPVVPTPQVAAVVPVADEGRVRRKVAAETLPAELLIQADESPALATQGPTVRVDALIPAPDSTRRTNGNADLEQLLFLAVNSHKQYPSVAKRQRRQGTAIVAFDLEPGGQLESVRVIDSSGSTLLDRSAIKAVKSISPFMPAREYLESPQQFSIDIVFDLGSVSG